MSETKILTADEWWAAHFRDDVRTKMPVHDRMIWDSSAENMEARYAPLVEAFDEILDDYWCEIDSAGGEEVRRRALRALKAVRV